MPEEKNTMPDLGLDGLTIDLDSDLYQKKEEIPEEKENKPAPVNRVRSVSITRRHVSTYRRAFGETQLLDLLGFDFKDGESHHVITGGDIDGLSYLKVVLRQQPLDYCLMSTWCMASEDVYQIKDWLENGKIKTMDCYVGEIFPGSYILEYALLKPLIEKHGGRVCVFMNHAKIFAGFGPKFAFGIETSANVNTNPRTENGCITIGQDIYEFYREFFDQIRSFDEKRTGGSS